MTEPAVNKGWQQLGGVANVGAAAVGDQASVVVSGGAVQGTGGPDVPALLDRLDELLAAHAAQLPAAAPMTATELRRELALRRPDRRRVADLLTQLGLFAQPAAPIVAILADLARLVIPSSP